jgi:hypothetical protein
MMMSNFFPLLSGPKRAKLCSNINRITSFFKHSKNATLISQLNQRHLTSFLNFILPAVGGGVKKGKWIDLDTVRGLYNSIYIYIYWYMNY